MAKNQLENNEVLERCTKCLLPVTHETLELDSEGICNVCRNNDEKAKINWNAKLIELDNLVEQYKGKYAYDCIVPFSGGKDSTWTLYYLMNRYPDLKPLVVRFNHGFLRENLRQTSVETFRKLGVDVHDFTPNWKVVRRLMLQSLIEKGDFCWHCHTGIYSYPMHVALKETVPLIFWGEPSAEYTAYYSYDDAEEVNEERFNKYINLGISADDMFIRLGGSIDERDLRCFKYPDVHELMKLGYRSVCLGSYIPWDVKMQVAKIKEELNWKGDQVEGVPPEYNYEKIECWMQGVRDYIKYLKRGYSRPSHLSAIDLRNGRIDVKDAKANIETYEGRRPKSLDIFLEYIGLNEDEFEQIVEQHVVSPWDIKYRKGGESDEVHDFGDWLRGEGLSRDQALKQCGDSGICLQCGKE